MLSSLPKNILLSLLNLYRDYISLYLPARCRFYPSCSNYAHESISEHGAINGMYLAFCRLLKCHPWHDGGHDPVPTKKNSPRRSCSFLHLPPQSSNKSEDSL